MKESRSKPKGRFWRWLIGVALIVPAAVLGLWVAVHRLPWLGPLCADGLRAVIGVEAVTDLEDFAYGVQDRFNRLWRKDEKPKAYWQVPSKADARARPATATTIAPGCTVPPFAPADVGPVHQSWSAPGDGQWVPLSDPPARQDDSPLMYKTLVHPDKNRSWAAVSVVAADLRRVDLHLVAGRREPLGQTEQAAAYQRPAIIPEKHQAELLAAFNGGFKAEHGHYGMKVDGVLLLPPRTKACWVGLLKSQALTMGDYGRLQEQEPQALWWRQTPECMVDGGQLHAGLRSEESTYWGATLDGQTVIRRSAIGLSSDGQVLYSGIGDHVTARALALGMKHVGAATVAQLDVNWSYPKFIVYQRRETDGQLIATPLCDGFELSEDEYLRQRAERDFFYLTRKSDQRVTQLVCGSEQKTSHHRPPRPRAAQDG